MHRQDDCYAAERSLAGARQLLQGMHFNFALLRRLCQQSPFFFAVGQVGFVPACFCARQVAGGMPNWVMNQRVKELAME